MKLSEKLINNLEFKKKKNSSLVSSIEKFKYHDLLNISNIIDDKKFLNEFSCGFNASHYSVLNNSLEVLFFVSNLYIKHKCDLNQPVKRTKNSTSIGDNTLEIAITNQKLEQYILLKSLGITTHKEYSYFLNQNSTSYFQNEFQSLNLPYEYSLANLFLLSYESVGLKLFYKDFHYEEKNQVIQEFFENHKYLCENYIDKPIFTVYSGFFEKLIAKKNNIDFNCFDFFAIYFVEGFKLKKEKIDFCFFNNFNNLFSENISEFFEQLNVSKYKSEMINTFISMKNLLNNENNNNLKNIKNFFQNYQIEKLLFSIELDNKLLNKNTHNKVLKI